MVTTPLLCAASCVAFFNELGVDQKEGSCRINVCWNDGVFQIWDYCPQNSSDLVVAYTLTHGSLQYPGITPIGDHLAKTFIRPTVIGTGKGGWIN